MTPLHLAFQQGSINVVRNLPAGVMLELLHARNEWWETPLHILSCLPHNVSASIFIEATKTLTTEESNSLEALEDKWGRTAYKVASESSNSIMLGLLKPPQISQSDRTYSSCSSDF